MIAKEQIQQLAEAAINGTGIFLVHISVGGSNRIFVEIDSPDGVSISDCTKIHRTIEAGLDRDSEDFELNVSSPGLENPFRVPQQYEKNVGRKVVVDLADGKQVKGTLKNFTGSGVEIESLTLEKNGKKKISVTHNHLLNLNEIKQTRVVVSVK